VSNLDDNTIQLTKVENPHQIFNSTKFKMTEPDSAEFALQLAVDALPYLPVNAGAEVMKAVGVASRSVKSQSTQVAFENYRESHAQWVEAGGSITEPAIIPAETIDKPAEGMAENWAKLTKKVKSRDGDGDKGTTDEGVEEKREERRPVP